MSLVVSSSRLVARALKPEQPSPTSVEKSVLRLATNSRILSPSDDAGGLAVRDALNTSVVINQRATRNIYDGSRILLQGQQAVEALGKNLISISELLTVASTQALAASQRAAMQQELDNLVNEYNRILTVSAQSGQGLFETIGGRPQFQAGVGTAAAISVDLFTQVFSSQTQTVGTPDPVYVTAITRVAETQGTVTGTLQNEIPAGRENPTLSADGRYIAYSSLASNLVAGDTNLFYDVFINDLSNSTATRVSVSTSGVQGDNNSYGGTVSSDGRYVAFTSFASNLVADDTNGTSDVFVRDTLLGTTQRVSTSSGGAQGDNNSFNPVFSRDGTKLLFASYSSNLVAEDTNATADLFVKDLISGTLTRVSTGTGGIQGNDRSLYGEFNSDGPKVVFQSFASNISTNDFNGVEDIFIKDLTGGAVTRVSTASGTSFAAGGASYGAAFSDDDKYITFSSDANNLTSYDLSPYTDVFRYNVSTQIIGTDVVSRYGLAAGANNTVSGIDSYISSSHDGKFVVFEARASNLVDGDTNGLSDVYVADTHTQTIARVNISSGGTQANNTSARPVISADGRYIGFLSFASNLVATDPSGFADVFVTNNPFYVAPALPTITTYYSGVAQASLSELPSLSLLSLTASENSMAIVSRFTRGSLRCIKEHSTR
jgi:flagellin-like hook-associated protein FlgL